MTSLFSKALYVGNLLYRVLLGLFGVKFAVGQLTLVSSDFKEIKVTTGFTPKDVWINPLHRCGIPVCQSDVDWFSREIVQDGFILYVKVNSDYRTIEWVAKG